MKKFIFYSLPSTKIKSEMLPEFILQPLCCVERKLKVFQRRFPLENLLRLFLNRFGTTGYMHSIYDNFCESVYSIRDVDILRQITTNDFDYFEDYFEVTSDESESDSLFGQDSFLLSEKKEHDMGTAFTGTRMRQMFELVVECTEDMVEHLILESKECASNQWQMEELFSRYASDVAASVIGLKVNSFKHPTDDFYMNFNKVQRGFGSLLIRAIPKFVRDLTFEFSSAHFERFFKSAISQEIKDRGREQTFRPDLINILMQMRSGELKNQDDETSNANIRFATLEKSMIEMDRANQIWSDDGIVSPCFQFFTSGLETAHIISFISYELAMHQDIQQKLYDEILETNRMLDGARIPYDLLLNLRYIDQVICELLRKFGFVSFNCIGMCILIFFQN